MSDSQMRRGELGRGIVKILKDAGEEGLSAKDVLARLKKEVTPEEFEKERTESGALRYETNARFMTTALAKAGWMTKNRRQWSLTEAGQKAYNSFADPREFQREAMKQYYQWKEGQPIGEDNTDNKSNNSTLLAGYAESISEDGDSTSLATLEEAQENAWTEIENHLAKMPPYNFQEVVAGLLEGMGYHVHWVAPPGPDGGVDIHAGTDSLGVSGKRIKVQVKRRAHTLPVSEVRSFQGVLEDGDMGIFISTGGFTREAEKVARQGQRRLVLVDASRFFDLWEEHYEQIPEAQRRLLPIKRVSFLDLSNIPKA